MVSAKLIALSAIAATCMGLIIGWYQTKDGSSDGAASVSSKSDYSLTVLGTLHTEDGSADTAMFYADKFNLDDNNPSVELRVNAWKHGGKVYVHSEHNGVLATYGDGGLESCQSYGQDVAFTMRGIADSLIDLDDSGKGTIPLSEDNSLSMDVHSVVEGGTPTEIPTLLGYAVPSGSDCANAGGSSGDRRLKEVDEIESMLDFHESTEDRRQLYQGGPSDREMWKMSVCSQYHGVFCNGGRRPEGEGWGRVAHWKSSNIFSHSASATVFQKGNTRVLAFEETGLGDCLGGNAGDCFTGLTDAGSDLDTGAIGCDAAGETHGGACKYTKALEGTVGDGESAGQTLESFMASSDIKFVTGWSLGGAAATVFAARHPGKYTTVTFGAFATAHGNQCRQPGRRYWRTADPAPSTFDHWTNPFPKFTHLSHDVQEAVEIHEWEYCAHPTNHWCLHCSGCGWGGCSGCHWYVCGSYCLAWNYATAYGMRNTWCNQQSMAAWDPLGFSSGFYNLLATHPNYDVVGFLN